MIMEEIRKAGGINEQLGFQRYPAIESATESVPESKSSCTKRLNNVYTLMSNLRLISFISKNYEVF